MSKSWCLHMRVLSCAKTCNTLLFSRTSVVWIFGKKHVKCSFIACAGWFWRLWVCRFYLNYYAVCAGYIPPGHGDSTSNATPLVLTPVSDSIAVFNEVGIVSETKALDFFSIQVSEAGSFVLYPDRLPSYAPVESDNFIRRSNLDLVVTVYDSSDNIIASNPGTPVQLPAAGTYYFSVTGTGSGDPVTTGYSAYGSLGQYQLEGYFESIIPL